MGRLFRKNLTKTIFINKGRFAGLLFNLYLAELMAFVICFANPYNDINVYFKTFVKSSRVCEKSCSCWVL
jgi:hypothetical protein